MSSISKSNSMPSWEGIKETALQNSNLQSDIRVGDNSLQITSYWGKFKVMLGLVRPSYFASKEETEANLKDHFDVYFSKKVCQLVEETGIDSNKESYQALVNEAMKNSNSITKKLTRNITGSSISTSEAIQEAHQEALQSLYLLRKNFTHPLLVPQFSKMKDGRWSVLQPASPPENWVLSGGGVKGTGYIGFIKAAEQVGVLQSLKRLAGSSAGAITAALMASGMTASEFEQASSRTSFLKILIGTSHDNVINQATSLIPGNIISGFTGSYAVERVNQEMVGSIKSYITSLGRSGFQAKTEETFSDPKDQRILINLEKSLRSFSFSFGFFIQKKATHMVTFKELALLGKIDSRFKELTITGYDLTAQKERYYSAIDFPDMPIAEAVRISMSLPVVFQAARDVMTGNKLGDGGIGSNIPAEVFANEPQEKTLVLGFDNNGRFYDIVNRGRTVLKATWMAKLFSGNPHFQKNAEDDAEKLKKAGPNAVLVEHGSLGIVSFAAGESRLHDAQRQAQIRALEAFSLRQNQAIYHIFENLEDAMEEMDDLQLEGIAVHYASNIQGSDSLAEEDRKLISQTAQTRLSKPGKMLVS